MAATRIPNRDLDQTRKNLRPGTKISDHEHLEIWDGRDILTESRGGTWYLKTNCVVVKFKESERRVYFHGDKTKELNLRLAREWVEDAIGPCCDLD